MVLSAIPLNPEFSVSIFENKHNNFIAPYISQIRPKETFKKYVCLRFPSFDPPTPFFALIRSQGPRLPQGTLGLARTHPLALNFYTCEIQRKEVSINIFG